jgi:hypothetical protein
LPRIDTDETRILDRRLGGDAAFLSEEKLAWRRRPELIRV